VELGSKAVMNHGSWVLIEVVVDKQVPIASFVNKSHLKENDDEIGIDNLKDTK
jgi:hypothetical protein